MYVHSGEAGTDRQVDKVRFLAAVSLRLGALRAQEAAGGPPVVVCGDLNIGHTERDIKNWKGNRGQAGFLPEERAFLDSWYASGWVDVARRLAGDVDGPYSWWSWRGKAFDTDAGWRIDVHVATEACAGRARFAAVDRAATYDARFSDHAPVVVGYEPAERRAQARSTRTGPMRPRRRVLLAGPEHDEVACRSGTRCRGTTSARPRRPPGAGARGRRRR